MERLETRMCEDPRAVGYAHMLEILNWSSLQIVLRRIRFALILWMSAVGIRRRGSPGSQSPCVLLCARRHNLTQRRKGWPRRENVKPELFKV
ncbi:hypothetical protein BKA93DRAFT_32266 [Sparassis latifolia]